MPFTSKMKGKMSALLKQKSKIKIESKERVKYEMYDITKKFRDGDGNITNVKT